MKKRKAKGHAASSGLNLEAQRRVWAETAGQINLRLVGLRQQSHHFQALAQVAETVPGFKGYYVMDIPGWFAAFAAMAIRREMDPAPDCRSLRQLLDDIARYGKPVPDFMGMPIDLVELRTFRKRLSFLSSKITHIADKEVAHATITGADATMRPTFQELYDCINEFESIAVRYKTYLTGQSVLTRDDGTAIPVRLAGQSAYRIEDPASLPQSGTPASS